MTNEERILSALEVVAEKVDKLEVMAEKVDKLEVMAEKIDKLEVMAEKVDKLEAMAEKVDKLEVMAEKIDKLEALTAKLEQGQLEMRSDIKTLKSDAQAAKFHMSTANERLDTMKNSILRIEMEHLPKIQAALDGSVTAIEHNKEQDKRIRVLENKTDRHDVEIFGLQQAAT